MSRALSVGWLSDFNDDKKTIKSNKFDCLIVLEKRVDPGEFRPDTLQRLKLRRLPSKDLDNVKIYEWPRPVSQLAVELAHITITLPYAMHPLLCRHTLQVTLPRAFHTMETHVPLHDSLIPASEQPDRKSVV